MADQNDKNLTPDNMDDPSSSGVSDIFSFDDILYGKSGDNNTEKAESAEEGTSAAPQEPTVSQQAPSPAGEDDGSIFGSGIFGRPVEGLRFNEEVDASWLDEIFKAPEPSQETEEADEQTVEMKPDAETTETIKQEPELPPAKPEPKSVRSVLEESKFSHEQDGTPYGYVAPVIRDSFRFEENSEIDFGPVEEEKASKPQAPVRQISPDGISAPSTAFRAVVEDYSEDDTTHEPEPPKKHKKKKGSKEDIPVTVRTPEKAEPDEGITGKPEEKKKEKKQGFLKRNFIVTKGDSTGNAVRKVIMCICVIAILFSAGYLIYDYFIAPMKTYNQIAELSGMIGEGNEVADVEALSKTYPGISFPEGMLEKYASLYARNQDFVGWLKIDGLGISLPVVQAKDNVKYLNIDFDGKPNKYGSLFMNCANHVGLTFDKNTTIFGHDMKDVKMFGSLIEYKSATGYQKAPVIEFNTIYGDYKWKVFAVYITNGTASEDNGYIFNYMYTSLTNDKAFEDYLGDVKVRSIYYPEVDIALSDKILTLSTCTYEFREARLVILARMVRKGESENVNISNVKFNVNPRYPAAYYAENNLSNPYASASKWYPS